MGMTWEEQLLALQALVGPEGVSLKIHRNAAHWNAEWSLTVTVSKSGAAESLRQVGANLEAVTNDLWSRITSVRAPDVLLVESGPRKGRRFRWAWFMWEEVES